MEAQVVEEWDREFTKSVRFNAGLDYDIERSIYAVFYEFDENQEPRFSIFCRVWRESKLGLIFCGRDCFRDLYELTTDILQRTKQYAKSVYKHKENNILVRYAAIYMLYSFYFKQPCRPRVRIKLSYDEFRDLSGLMDEARRDLHYDILYAWSKLILSHAFHYSVVSDHMGLEVAKALERRDSDELKQGEGAEGYFHTKEFRTMMKRLGKAHDNYVEIKKAVCKHPKSGYSLNSMNVDLLQTITELTSAQHMAELKTKQDPSQEDIGEKRKKLKEKFFSSVLEPSLRKFVPDEEEGEKEDIPGQDSEDEWKPRGGGVSKRKPQPGLSNKGKGRGKKSKKKNQPEGGERGKKREKI